MLIASDCISQELAIRDTVIVNDINKRASFIYDNNDSALFFLTKTAFKGQPFFAAEITCYLKNKIPNRIVVVYTIDSGKLAREFYLENHKLIFCYETMEYFDKYARKKKWKNFKNLPAYESRYYFADEKIVYQKHRGLDAMESGKASLLIAEKNYLLARTSSK